MSIEVMKRIKSLLQDTKMIDSHTISAVVAECDAVILTQQPDNASCRSVQKRIEAQQPATGEPVLFIHPDTFAMNNAHVGAWKPGHELTSYIPLYTHPAQNVPDDSKRLDYLQDRGATIDLIAGVADFYPMQFRVGGLHSSASIDVRAAIDAAMLAAK